MFFGSGCSARAILRRARNITCYLSSLGLTALPSQILAAGALEIALTRKTPAYDACYITAAAKLGLPLITADEKLVRQTKNASYDVVWLGGSV